MTKRFRLLTLAAMLVLPLAACDEGETVAPVDNGTITGTVTIGGAGASGVTVTLSNGQTATTNASGQYTFSDVPAGAYTVTISGFPADVAFPATTQAAVVATSGQVVTVNFAGSRIQTSALVVSVTRDGAGVSGATVTVSGAASRTATTDANGQASIGGLPAGSYTVAVSGLPSGTACAATSQTTTLAAGESKVVAFSCSSSASGVISGRLFVDENNQNDVYDAGLEDDLAAANVAITLEGPQVGNTTTVQTDANGHFQFTGLAPGSYNVTIDATDPDIPAGFEYGGASATRTVVLAAGDAAQVNFPFDIVTQQLQVFAFLGRDDNAAVGVSTTIPTGVAPVEGVTLDLYPTEADALALTNRLDRATTDATGGVTFEFDREDDTSPGGPSDRIVFATFVSAPDNFHVLNGEARIEIPYAGRSATAMAPDTFDLLNTRVTMAFDAISSTGEPLAGWAGALWLNDTTAAAIASGVTNANGRIAFTDAVAAGSLPDTFYMRLSTAQAAAGSHAFTQTPVPEHGSAANLYLRYVHQGLVPAGDTVDVGDERVTFLDTDVFVRVYHERDDSVPGGPPRYSSGDNIENVDNIKVTLSWGDSARVDVTPDPATGNITFGNVPTGMGPYTITARSISANQVVLNDTIVTVADLSGGTAGLTRVCPLGTETAAGCGTFAFKYNNASITGKVKAADSTAASGIIVTVTPTAANIQGSATMVDTTDAAGLFAFAGLREGPYTVSITPTSVWGASNPSTGTISVDMENNGDNDILNFIVRRLDTAIKGVVVNDRDMDLNTIDAGEALAGVTIELYRDGDGAAVTLDTLVATDVTDAQGAYTFEGLPEGRYVVRAVQPSGAVVLRAYEASGAVRDTAIVNTAATTVGEGANNTRTVGTTSPNPLPRWNYDNSSVMFNDRTHFTFLVNGNVATGQITSNPGGTPMANELVRLRRCVVSAGSTSPPSAGTCTTYFPGDPLTTLTGADGFFTFSNLLEGVYEVMPVDPSTPPAQLFRLVRNGESADNERGDFTQP